MKAFLLLFLINLLLIASAQAAELPTRKVLTLDVAKEVAAAAATFAKQDNLNIAIVILDEAGKLKYLEAMDGPVPATAEIALAKATTAYNFRQPSKNFYDRVMNGEHGLTKLPLAYPFEGGEPLMAGDQLVGAIGISGAKATQDGQIARAGATAFKNIVGE